MRTREESFMKDWGYNADRIDIEHRLRYLGTQNTFEGKEVNSLLERLQEIKMKLKRFYKLEEV